jgi:thiamine-phosphate pyrophosphorylase
MKNPALKLAVYTAPGFVENEYALLSRLFDAGLERLHLYKPGFSLDAIYEWLEQIGRNCWPQITLHVYEQWVTATVGGYHLSRAYLQHHSLGETVARMLPGQTVSVSAHSPQDWIQWKDAVHAVVVSPVFESISKPDHFPVELLDTWKQTFATHPGKAEKIALGGVTPANVPALQDAGFDTIALSGWLWQEPAKAAEHFTTIQAIG